MKPKHEKTLRRLKVGDLILVGGEDWTTDESNWHDVNSLNPNRPAFMWIPGFFLGADIHSVWWAGIYGVFSEAKPDCKYIHSMSREAIHEIIPLRRVKLRRIISNKKGFTHGVNNPST